MGTFKKRRYESPGELLSAIGRLAVKPRSLVELVTGRGKLRPEFREQIMLAVTSVNKCRYCSFVHTLVALKEGAALSEIQALLAGSIDEVEDHDKEALLYAQHWADTNGHPEVEARLRLVERYGDDQASAIETAIEAIMVGNYFGNTVDYCLHTLSGGRLARES